MKLACVVGAGLVGSQVATALEERGYTVIVIDDRRPLAGSAAAACLVKHEWLASLGEGVTGPAFDFLGRYQQHEAPGLNGAFYYEPSDILLSAGNVVEAEVISIVPKGYGATVTVAVENPHEVPVIPAAHYITGSKSFEVRTGFDVVVVAAGAWTESLLTHVPNHGVKVTGRMGSAMVWNTSNLAGGAIGNFIKPWAPYKQMVGLQRAKDYWLGDGSAILPKNYTKERKQESISRLTMELLQRTTLTLHGVAFPDHIIDGIRPYTPEPAGTCREVSPGLWAAVGARKFGTVVGAYCAQKIAKEVP